MPSLGGGEIIALAIIIIALFGWKKLPDMARSLGRSARVFKSEVDEMKRDGREEPSEASQTTVSGGVVDHERPAPETPEQAHDVRAPRTDNGPTV